MRGREIRTGAGLEESRLNQDFIDALRKYGTPVLLIILIVTVGWVGWQRWQASKNAKRATAFVDLEAQMPRQDLSLGMMPRDVSPDVLVRVAEDHAGEGSAPLLARLAAGDQWLASAARGVQPGAELDPLTGELKRAEDALDAAGVTELLGKAKGQYDAVLSATEAVPGKAVLALRALFGLAGVAETAALTDATQWDVAKGLYDRAAGLAERSKFATIAEVARERGKSIDELKALPPLLAREQVQSYTKPEPVAPAVVPGGASGAAPDVGGPMIVAPAVPSGGGGGGGSVNPGGGAPANP